MKRILLFIFLVVFIEQNTFSQNIIIDESDDVVETIIETIKIGKVWSGHPVGFCLLTHGNRQYIAYYNDDRQMVVGQRNLDEANFYLHVLAPTSNSGKPPGYRTEETGTMLGWDSHNGVTLCIDEEGFIHLSGNMHVNLLTYFRSTKPNDISTLEQVIEMVGSEEKECTYPKFMKDREGNLIFHYRDGHSGDGNEIYNIYSTETKTWKRLLNTPLTDGQGLMNAYLSRPTLMADNWYHVYWVWRDSTDCATNHDLSYMKSPNLKNWFNAFWEPVDLPTTIQNKSLIVDPIPPKGGIINLAARLCLDENNKPVFIYHKYCPDGDLEFFVAQLDENKWISKQITDFDYRWEFSGGGSMGGKIEVRLKDFKRRNDGYYEYSYWHAKYGNNTILLDKNFDNAGTVLKSKPIEETMELEGDFPGLQIRTRRDIGKTYEEGVRYLLKWETLPSNRDRRRKKPWPNPSQLYLLKSKEK